MTLRDLAAATNVSAEHIRKLELGRYEARLDHLRAFAGALRVDLADLIGAGE